MTGIVQHREGDAASYILAVLDGQVIGVPTLSIRDIVRLNAITRVPTAPGHVRGVANLRGRIVTVIDTKFLFGYPKGGSNYCITIEGKNGFYGFLVDSVDRVIDVPRAVMGAIPSEVAGFFHNSAAGIYRDEGKLAILLDMERLIDSLDGNSSMLAAAE